MSPQCYALAPAGSTLHFPSLTIADMIELAGFLGAFVATLVAIPPLLRLAPRWGMVAVPEGRRVHEGDTPLVGGIGMGLAFLAVYLAIGLYGAPTLSSGLTAAIVIVLVGGVLDDMHELRSLLKFAFQIAAATVLVLYGEATLLTQLGPLFQAASFSLGIFAVPLSVFSIVGVMNAVNMADGIDGLAGTLSLLGFAVFGALAALVGETTVFVVACTGIGVTAGFLCFNTRTPRRSSALVFMGDTGSHFLGLLLAWCAIRLYNAEPQGLNAVTAGWILGVMLGDTLCVMVRRVLHGRSPFKGDREHLHHLLLGAGLSVPQTVGAMAAISVSAGVIAVAAERAGVPAYLMFYAYLVVLGAYGAVSELAFRKRREAPAKPA